MLIQGKMVLLHLNLLLPIITINEKIYNFNPVYNDWQSVFKLIQNIDLQLMMKLLIY